MTFSYGLRFETQNYIHDHADFAPRTSVAWGVTKKTVLRAGAGFFYDRFNLNSEEAVFRNNGTNQQQNIISATPATTTTAAVPVNPACNPEQPEPGDSMPGLDQWAIYDGQYLLDAARALLHPDQCGCGMSSCSRVRRCR